MLGLHMGRCSPLDLTWKWPGGRSSLPFNWMSIRSVRKNSRQLLKQKLHVRKTVQQEQGRSCRMSQMTENSSEFNPRAMSTEGAGP